ncbi:MAG: protein translocase subunit SecF [Candidatus Poribacteria bacterium]|nr:protein translocase subunit SecF [Candidatus Poribacteria bacterium]
MELLKDTNFDFISKHRAGFVFSAVIIAIGLIFLVIHQGLNFGIDFRGGVKIQAKFNGAVTQAELQAKLTEVGYERATIQIDASKNEAFVSMGHRPEFQRQGTSVGRILTDALLEGGDGWQALPGGVNISEVLPSVGRDLKLAALWSVLGAIAILLVYISWRFEFRFAIGAIAALVHDILITLGVFAVLSKEINLPTVAAFLTIIGYSLNDTIVVFDRIRENTQSLRGTDYVSVLNRSINQSLSRTVITSLTTLFVVLVIFVITGSGEEINTFALALIVGVLVGTYSSVFIASPILYLWNRGRPQEA